MFVKLIVTVVLLLCPNSFFAISKKQMNGVLDKKVTIRAENYTRSDLLDLLSFRAKVPIGFEEIPCEEDDDEKRLTINITAGTVRDILNEFVKEDQRYTWEMTGNVINVIPKDTKDSILEVIIPFFSFTNVNIEDVRISILDAPEVKAKLGKLNLTERKAIDYDGPLRDMSQFSINLSNATVREILNEVIRLGHSRYWKAYRLGNSNKYFTVELISKTVKI